MTAILSSAQPLATENRRPAIPDAQPGEIRVTGAHKSFGTNRVLRGVDLEIHRGEMVAIVGASGGGKTVLLKLIIGRLHPDAGRVFVADHETPGSPLIDLATLDQEGMDRLRRHWAVVFQKNALFTGTVFDNIALGLMDVKGLDEAQSRRRASDVLRSVGLDPEQVLDLRRDKLSGGMAKRVAIARALALDPVLVFYDEPTTGLDPEHAEQIQDLIREVHCSSPDLGGRRTTVVITHDAGLLYRLKPRVVMLHDGRVFFDGPAQEFEQSASPVVRPYLDLMPLLQRRVGSPPVKL
jgi:phospholipid/cholesterol/gamma-HCH transport system ATP-binding protein